MLDMQEMRLDGKAAIVTGAARGIGRAIAVRLAKLGANVLAVDKDFAAAAAYGETIPGGFVVREIASLGGHAAAFEGDLTRCADAAAMVASCVESFGRLDVLVNNAGGMLPPEVPSQPSTLSPDDDRLLFDLNYRTMVNACQAAVPAMKSRGQGVIVNMSSGLGRFVAPGGRGASYGAAKAAVSHFTRSLAAELGPSGIRVNAIAPGVVLTARVAEQAARNPGGRASNPQDVPLGRFADAEDCALVVQFFATELSRYVTGQTLSVCGGRLLIPA